MFKFILCVIVILQLSTLTYCYVEALTANLDNGLTHFQPMIAMLCGQHGKFHNQYLNEQKQWITDNDPSATCIKDKLEILEYCRKVYPKKDIRNIVESNHYYKIDNWKYVKTARHRSTTNDKQHFVKPIRCLEGNFQSDALLVPEHCVFDHIHNSSVCEANAYWNKTANQSCKDKGKMLQSYAMLLPCGVGIFNGVEFVCCPASTSNSQNEISDKPINSETPEFNLPAYPSIDKPKTNERLIKSNNKKLLNKKQRFNKLDQEEEDDDNSSMEDDSDDYWDQQNKNDDESNNGINNKDQDTLPKKGKKLPKANNQEEDDDDYEEDSDDDYEKEQDYKSASTTTTTTTTTTETPLEHYYSHFDSKNEHNLYKLAEESLKKIQLDKMKKVFKDYAEFQTRLSEKNIKKSKKNQKKSSRLNDDSEIDENLRKKMEKRYEDALESLEMQNNEEKQQLNAMHQQRVLTLINMKKQEATDCYTSSLNQTPLKPRKIQKCLEKLMKSLEKDRIHTLHHYKHLLQVSSKLALREKAATLTHLENLIVIANRSISMLNKYPTLNDKIRNHIIAFWHNLRGVPFNQVISRETEQQIMEKYEEEIAQKQQEKEHRKMLEEVKKEEETSVAKKEQTKDEQEQKTNQQSTSKQQQNPSPSTASIEEKNGANKINASSNIKYTARYTANSKQPIKQIGKQANQLHQQIKPIVSNMQHSKQHHEISSFKLIEQLPEQNHLTGYKIESKHSLMNYSIAGVVIVLLATVCGIIIYRSGHQSSHLSQGFVALHQQQQQSQQINNEQEQVESLQINGYENPTYKYLEKNGI